MLKIQSLSNVIRTRFANGLKFARSNFGHLSSDVFDKQTDNIKNAGDYLKDVIFERKGKVFSTIKATFQGKPIATNKRKLFKQIEDLNLSNDVTDSKKITKKEINLNLEALGKSDCGTIARISKFFLEINQPENKNLASIKRRLHYNKNTLSIINKLSKHPIGFNSEEIAEIVRVNAYLNPKYLNILLDSNPNQIKNSSFLSCLKNLCIQGEEEKYSINTAQRIREKLANVEDPKIKDFVESKFIDISQDLKAKLEMSPKRVLLKDGAGDFIKCELLLDAYHCENNTYSMLYSETEEYYKTIKKEIPELANQISRDISSNIHELKDSYKRLIETTDAGIFNEAVRLEPTKQFIGRFAEKESEMANYLYEKYFLSKIGDCELKDKCIEIEKELGTKVFIDNNTDLSMLDIIKRELVEWKNNGKREAKIPSIFDFSKMKQPFVDKGDVFTAGYSRRMDHSINIPVDTFYYATSNTLRHEMTHLNDTEFMRKSGNINGIDFDRIRKYKLFLEELKAGGIQGYGLKYAYTDKMEFIAVAASGDTREYSDEFKKVLTKLGLPEWTFNFKQLNPPMKMAKVLQDSFIDKAMHRLRDEEKNITFPNGIMLTGDRINLKETAEWLAEKSCFAYHKIDFNEFTQEKVIKKLGIIAETFKDYDERTIIQIDNFKRFTTPGEENDKFISKFKSFLSKCSDDYNCTVITNVDNPSEIDPNLMAVHRFQIKFDEEGNQIL